MMMYNKDEKTGELRHYGIKGQKWGVRRYQNEDGTYTKEGMQRRLRDSGLRGSRSERSLIKKWDKKQEKISKKFDTHTEKILQDRRAGLKVSDRRIKKAIRLGTEHRKYDLQAKDLKKYYQAEKDMADGVSTAAGVGTLIGGPLLGIAAGTIWSSTGGKEATDRGTEYYFNLEDEAREMTISDLKKHGVIK